MANCNRGMTLKEQTCNWPSDDLTAPDYARISAGNLNLISIQQLNNSRGRARHESRPTHRQQTDIRRMKSINVFGRIDGFDGDRIVNLFWQRQLHENPVNVIVRVQSTYYGEKFIARSRRRQIDLFRLDTNLTARANFVAY